MTDHGADLLIRAATVHTFVPGQCPQRAMAVRGDRIVALSPDQATDRHPVLVKRGGHNDVVNHYALRLAGITGETPVPAGGVIGRFGLDGGLEAGATEEPYACDHAFFGTLISEPGALVEVVETVVRRGWRVGTHACGDRAVRILLDVYERVLQDNPGLPAGTLVMEHGGLAGPGQRARAVAPGIPVTIQQPLLHDTAEVERGFWGQERVATTRP